MLFSAENLDGFVLFGLIKLIGYTAVAAAAKRDFAPTKVPAVLVGVARTFLGILVGVSFGRLSFAFIDSVLWFYAALLPLRLGEWYLTIRVFLDPSGAQRGPTLRWLLLGPLASYALDLPAVLGAFVVGRAWIC